jgi:hypothetical protein
MVIVYLTTLRVAQFILHQKILNWFLVSGRQGGSNYTTVVCRPVHSSMPSFYCQEKPLILHSGCSLLKIKILIYASGLSVGIRNLALFQTKIFHEINSIVQNLTYRFDSISASKKYPNSPNVYNNSRFIIIIIKV